MSNTPNHTFWRKNFVRIGSSFILIISAFTTQAQTLNHTQFLQKVGSQNTEMLAEKYNLSIADANVQASRVFPDPELSVSYSNNEDWSMQMGQSLEVGLDYSFSLGGVRGAGIRVAKSERELTQYALADYMRNLRFSASEAYADAWLKRMQAEVCRLGYEDMLKIAQGDSIRLKHGDINVTDALQSGLEARSMKNDWLKARAEYRNSLAQLSTFIGGETVDGVSELCDSLALMNGPVQTLADLCAQARMERSDLKAAAANKELSVNNQRLEKASRALELTLSAGYARNREALNEIAPSPTHNSYTVGVSIPLKFSSANKGARTAARLAVEQSEKVYENTLQQIDAEVVQAYNSYQAAREVLENYQNDILKHAAQILENRKAGYLAGETDIVELLVAQRTYQEVLSSYYEEYADAFLAQQNLIRVSSSNSTF